MIAGPALPVSARPIATSVTSTPHRVRLATACA